MSTDDFYSIELRTMIEHFNQQTSVLYTILNALAYLMSKQSDESASKLYEDLKDVNHIIYSELNKIYPSGLVRLHSKNNPASKGTGPLFPGDFFPPYTMN